MSVERAPRRAEAANEGGRVGALLRNWRRARHLSQLALAHEADVSPRHVCFVETGRARPSRHMIHVLAETLDVPLRERNALLLAAGFAPTYREAEPDLAREDLAPVRTAVEAILRQQEPYPAVVMNRHWNLVEANGAANRFFAFLLGEVDNEEPLNVLRTMFDPRGLRPYVASWEATAEALFRRVHREAVGGVVDEATKHLLDELLELADVPRSWRDGPFDAPILPVIPVVFEKDDKTFRYFSTVTTLGTPQDVLLQELRIECFFPLDATTRRLAQELAPSS